MAILNWNDSLSVNVAEIDQQHQQLVKMANKLNNAMRERKAKDVLGEIIDGLIKYAVVHFATEEKYFHQFNYPETAVHEKEHSDFAKTVTEFKQGFDENRLMLSIDIMDFLQDWLITHIKGSDKRYSSFFNEKGLK